MSYDPACEDLARHFLSDVAAPLLVQKLAQHIQDEIKDWIISETKRLGEIAFPSYRNGLPVPGDDQ
jgi:hypothetical protein